MERVVDRSIRIKVTNDCQWTCNFCHNEGTELPDNHNADNRTSAFLDPLTLTLPRVGNLRITEAAGAWMETLRGLGIEEVHLTGGEPTLLPGLPRLVRQFVDTGMSVKLTTNGQGSSRRYEELAEAGLSGLTFSILSLDPEQFLSTQRPPQIPGLDPLTWASRMIEREKTNILLAKDLGVDVKINTAILDKDDYPRVDAVREFAEQNGITLVLLPSIGEQEDTSPAVFQYAREHGTYVSTKEAANNSNSSQIFETPRGLQLRAKYLRQYNPEVVCGDCPNNGQPSCFERFYGLRMEFREEKPWVRLCIQRSTPRTVMPLETFAKEGIIDKL